MTRWLAIIAALVCLTGWRVLPAGGGGSGGGGGTQVAALTSSAYTFTAPLSAGATIGNLSTLLTTGGSGSPTYSIVSSGTDNTGLACPATGATDFQLSGGTLQAGSGGLNKSTAYVCVQTSQAGVPNFVQRMMLNSTTPRFTQAVAIGGSQTVSGSYSAYWQALGPAYGMSVTGRSSSAPVYACGAAIGTFISDATGTVGASGNPYWHVMLGEDDANNFGAGAYESVFTDCLTADLAWLTVPGKVLATSATQGVSNHWSAYTAAGLSSGTALQSSTAGDTLTFTINITKGVSNGFTTQCSPPLSTCASGHIYAWWGGPGSSSISYSIDGGSSTTVSADAYGTATGAQMIDAAQLTLGSHTIAIQVVSGTVVVFAAGTPTPSPATQISVAGVIKQQGDANSAATKAYDIDVANVVDVLAAEGNDLIYAPVRNYVNLSTDYASTLNLNASGQIHLAQAFEENIHPCISAVDASSNPVTYPSYAAAVTPLFTCLVADDEGTTTATVDPSNSFAPGYLWYGTGNTPRGVETDSHTVTPGPNKPIQSWVSTGSNGLSITVPSGQNTVPSWFPAMMSCGVPANARTSPATPPFIVGFYGAMGGFYMEDQIYFTTAGYTDWSLPREMFDFGPNTTTYPLWTFTEIDLPDGGFNAVIDTLWGEYNGTHPGDSGTAWITQVGSGFGTPVSGQVSGHLVRSPLQSGLGHTSLIFFKNGTSSGEKATNNDYNDPVTSHPCLLINAISTGGPVTIRYERLWQQPI